METTTQPKNRAYKVGECYVKNPKFNADKNEFDYELTRFINECHLMTEEVATYFHRMNGEGQIRIINTIDVL